MHTHQFVVVEQITKPRPGATSYNGGIPGALVVCADCLHSREVYADGTMVVVAFGNVGYGTSLNVPGETGTTARTNDQSR